jgi:hypothetical protein
MNTISIKKDTFIIFLALLGSIAYGFFVFAAVQRLFFLDSGDIGSYVLYFNTMGRPAYNDLTFHGDTIFRYGVYHLREYFNVEIITLLSSLAFLTSSIIFYILSVSIRSSKYFIYILPPFLMVFLTPQVTNLFASGIRSSIAFSLLMIAIIYFKGVTKYILFVLSSLIHLSMVPIISLFILFHMVNRIKTGSTFIVPLFVLLLYSFFVALFSNVYKVNLTPVGQSISFNFLILLLGILIIFTNKKAIQNIYGFISIALILIYLCGVIIDVSFFRYIGYSIIFYFLFLIEKGKRNTIQVFTLGYLPFFLLTSYFTITNVV